MFHDEPCQQNNDHFPNQFLSMPDLDDQVPTEVNSGVELLAEFNIDNDNEQDVTTNKDKTNDLNSLNCVLPSISNDHIDDVSMAEASPYLRCFYCINHIINVACIMYKYKESKIWLLLITYIGIRTILQYANCTLHR